MTDIVEFRKTAQEHGICDKYLKLWDSCISKKEMFELGCRIEPATYLAQSISEGWGVYPEDIRYNFGMFINGQYKVSVKKGDGEYTSQMWCCANNKFVLADTTVCVLLKCDVDVFVKDFNICRIIADKCSKIRLHVGKDCGVIVETFSDNVSIEENYGKDNIKIKRLG